LSAVFSAIIDEASPQFQTRKRQELIKRIQQVTGRKLAVYTASMSHPISGIMHLDAPLFEDCMRVCEGSKGDLMINSPGGDANVAEKILRMCRFRFNEEFNVIIPNYAKSAATMIALGADKILMGYLSEIGPADPQITNVLPNGQTQLIPARAYIQGLEFIRERINKGESAIVYAPIIAQIRPEMIAYCQDAIDFSKDFLRRWLPQGVLKGSNINPEDVIKELVVGETYKSHGQVIGYEDAKSLLGDRVELIDPKGDLWNLVWELYLRSTHALSMMPDAAKLFETEKSSTTMQIRVMAPAPTINLPIQPRPPPSQPQGQPFTPPSRPQGQPGVPPSQPPSQPAPSPQPQSSQPAETS